MAALRHLAITILRLTSATHAEPGVGRPRSRSAECGSRDGQAGRVPLAFSCRLIEQPV